MLNRRVAAVVVFLWVAFSAASLRAASPVEPGFQSIDKELVQLGRQIPGFGGLFFDEQGRPTLYLLDPEGAGDAARKVLGADVQILQGEYEFARLAEWRAELRPLLALPGVVFLDVDEARNRVVVGVDVTSPRKSAVREGLETRLAATGVPRPAIVLEETAPIKPLLTVQDKFQPAPGGVQIVFPIDPPIFGVCTLGFNAYRGQTFGFVTNSHCSDVQGELNGTRYFSGNPFTPAIGSELIDPPYSTGPDCPAGRRCRFSDSLFVKYNQVKLGGLGKIARPTAGSADVGSLTLKPINSRFAIKARAGSPLVGDAVHKVGRTTGWTFGTVVATCVDVNQGDNDTSLFCQTVVRGGGAPGDSGSPAFYRAAGNQVKLAGILWGGGTDAQGATIYVFSPLANIEAELGPLKIN
jgi:hypothetical protein